MVPVDGSKVRPEIDEYTPPEVPVNVTLTGAIDEQKGVPKYEIIAVGKGVTVTAVVAITIPHPFAAGIV